MTNPVDYAAQKTDIQPIFLGSEIEQPAIEKAFFHIIPVPFEKSVSYGGGTANGPAAIIAASHQLETYDGESEPCLAGIYTHQAIECHQEITALQQSIRTATHAAAAKQKIPFVLGGEHTVSYGAVMGVVDAYPDEKIGIIQFDAHADLRESYEGSIWSHASVMKRLVDEGLPLLQLGVRALSMEEQAVRDAHSGQIHYIDAKQMCRKPMHTLTLPEAFPKKVYLSVDIDGLDSAIMPATGTPVAGGLSFWQLIDLIDSIAQTREIVGMDLVEFAPIKGLHSYDFMAADIAYKMMGIVSRHQLA